MYRQRIIEDATKLFIMQGVKASTMDDIAKYMRISKRTIYEHFKAKRELIVSIIDYLNQCKMNENEEIFARSENVLQGFLESLKCNKYSAINGKMVKIMMEFHRYYPDIVIGKLNSFRKEEGIAKIRKLLVRGIDEGVFRQNLNPEVSAYVFSEQAMLIFGELSAKLDVSTDNMDISAQQFMLDLFFNFLRGISTPKGVEIIDGYIGVVFETYNARP